MSKAYSRKLVDRFMLIYNRLLENMHNDKYIKTLKIIINEFNKRGWYSFWRELNYYISSKDHTIVAIPPLDEPEPKIIEIETDKVYTFRKIDDLTIRDRTLDNKKKIIVKLIVKNLLTKRLLKEAY